MEREPNGVVDGDILIKQEGGMLLVSRETVNCAVKVSPSGEASTSTDLKIVKSDFKLL